MGLTETQAIWDLIQKSHLILITFPSHESDDALAASLSLGEFFRKNNLKFEIVSPNFQAPTKLSFLKGIDKIQSNINQLKKFQISLDLTKSKIQEFNYEISDNQLNIFITPKNGIFSAEDISSKSSDYRYDLIICVGTTDLEKLGQLYETHAEFFYNTPIINIDHSGLNEHYGQLNLIDLNATSSTEVVYSWCRQLQPGILDQELATIFLTGIILQTRGFRSDRITPRTLETVSQLIIAGAKREEIVHRLYRTKSIATLKIWGKMLANLKHDPRFGLVWASLSYQDLEENGSEENLKEAVEELINTSPDAKIVCLLYETSDKTIRCLTSVDKSVNALGLTGVFRPDGNPTLARFLVKNYSNLKDASDVVLTEIKNHLVEKGLVN